MHQINAQPRVNHASGRSPVMTGSYELVWVLVSIVVTMLASFAAFDFAGRVRSDSGSNDLGWIRAEAPCWD